MSGICPNRLERLAALLRDHVERGEIAGAVALLARRDAVYVCAEGSLALDQSGKMERDTIFRIASMTKPVAAVAAMMLVEETKLRLDDPVERFLPELANRRVLRRMDGPLDDTVPANRPITLRDILTMRCGLGMVSTQSGLPIQKAFAELGVSAGPNPSPFSPDEMMRRYATLPLMHQPGERWLYHNGFDLLGVLIARACRMKLEDFLSERIFEPLGMWDTAYRVPDAKRSRLASCYVQDKDGLVPFGDADADSFASAATGLYSTADDYLAFGQMMLNFGLYGGARLLARPTVELMVMDHITEAQKAASQFFPGFWDNCGYGFGLSVTTQRTTTASVPGTFGWDGGFGTTWRSDPQEGFVTILLLQRLFDETVIKLHDDFITLAYQALND